MPCNPAKAWQHVGMNTATTKAPRKTTRDIQQLEAKVCQILDVPTLETRNRDFLDFHSVSVATIREIIELAYQAGRAAQR